MSGGHFEYQESYLGYIAEQLERDIEYNDVEHEAAKASDSPYGYQHPPEMIEYLQAMAAELHQLKELLMDYDRFVSGDTGSEQHFLNKAKMFLPRTTHCDSSSVAGD